MHAALSEFLDGDLLPVRVAELRAHLAECDRCAQSGADVSAVLDGLRAELGVPTPLSPDASARLHARIAAVIST